MTGTRWAVRVLAIVALIAAMVLPVSAAAQVARSGNAVATGTSVDIHLFWTATCPHCAKARRFLERLVPTIPGARLRSHELDGDARREAAYVSLSQRFNNDPPGVPLIVIGGDAFVGYGDDATTGAALERQIRACLDAPCNDVAGPIFAEVGATDSGASLSTDARAPSVTRPELPKTVWLPGFGEVDTGSLSLPMLTVVLAAVDGFNPCAMWVLVFLIGLLIGMQDHVRMWAYGLTFLVTSGAMYFAFMAAWLNLFLFIGSLVWVRAAIGLLAVGAGAYHLREFISNPDATCPVTTSGERQRVMERLRNAVSERSFLVAILGIMALAVAVNLIELLCSAGIPAVYAQVLALSNLPTPAYYGLLTLYIAVFMLDDVVVFVAAMVTLQACGLQTSFSRWSRLVGGCVMLAIGVLLVFKPEWLIMI